jgi:cytochrome oxidase Cu insertion factor (SCO1/SenC/PrrC family)
MRVLAFGCLFLMACSSGEPAKEAASVSEQTPQSSAGSAVGEQATPFSLPDDSGTEVTLDQFRDQRAVLLAFYPEDFTGG